MGWIKFKNQNSEIYGIMKLVPFIPTAEVSVDTVEIPYGTPVTIKKGYKQIITPTFTLGINNMSQQNIYNIYDWLHGDGELITSKEPNVCFKAEIYSALTIRRLSERLGELDFQFSCDPFRYDVNNNIETVDFTEAASQRHAAIKNEGNMTAYPEFEITASDNFTVWINGRYESINYGSGTYKISTEYCSVIKDGVIISVNPNWNNLSLKPGDNGLTVTKSVTEFKIRKNVRWH